MAFKIHYKASVEYDLRKLSQTEITKILNKTEKDLSQDPDIGKPLKGTFKGLFRHRLGNYRVIYTKTIDGVLVLRIAHRKDAYK